MKKTFKPDSDTGRRWTGLTLLPVPGSETESMKCAAEPVCPTAAHFPLPCPICLSEEHQTLSRHQNKDLNRCLACGASFVVPQPSPKDAAAHFQNDSGVVPEDLHHRFERNRERVLVRVAHQIKRRQEGGKILDVGCATGFFLARFFPASRWQKWAVELSPRKAQIAAQNGIQVHAGDIHQAQFEERSFDVITVLDAFYYFPDPHSALNEFHRILKNDGLLLLELPWAGSRIWRRSRIPRWLLRDRPVPLLESSDHLFYYTQKSISGLLDRCGFRVEAVLALPGNRQETIFRDFLCRAYSFFSAMIQAVSRSKCFLGPRFLVVAANQPLTASGANPFALRRNR